MNSLLLEKFLVLTNKFNNLLKEGTEFTSAVEAFKQSNEGDRFKIIVSNPTATGHHSGVKGNKYVSDQIIVKQGNYFVPDTDLDIDPEAYEHGRRKKRMYLPADLDSNNEKLYLFKM